MRICSTRVTREVVGNNIALIQARHHEFAAARALLDEHGEWSGDLEQVTKDGRTLAIHRLPRM